MELKISIQDYILWLLALMLLTTISCKKEDNSLFTVDQLITDIDGNVYNTIKINNQVWMAENLKTKTYNNGDLIGTTIPASMDLSNELSPKYEWSYEGNESGFTALPSGHRYENGFFSSIGDGPVWWSATEYNDGKAWFRSLGYSTKAVRRDNYTKKDGMAIRCIKD